MKLDDFVSSTLWIWHNATPAADRCQIRPSLLSIYSFSYDWQLSDSSTSRTALSPISTSNCPIKTFNSETNFLEAAVTQNLLGNIAVLDVLKEAIQSRTVYHCIHTQTQHVDSINSGSLHTHMSTDSPTNHMSTITSLGCNRLPTQLCKCIKLLYLMNSYCQCQR